MGGLDSVTLLHALTQPQLNLFPNPTNRLDSQFDWFRELILLDIQVQRRPWNASEFTHARESQYFHALHLEVVSYRAFPCPKKNPQDGNFLSFASRDRQIGMTSTASTRSATAITFARKGQSFPSSNLPENSQNPSTMNLESFLKQPRVRLYQQDILTLLKGSYGWMER